ncbi:predicted protein [Uncinocarpus reesii 1704]|uniref:Methyltransferase domain-containing protein n=1 Tax=Uncinocarpus reesii (strain UAMH 1704) TaxID=336963 RepID=C4JIM3_UNCRE|nr:uncharacterized protein UREG_02884 [Uncinocarpus reesii 1704]EEP78035.1 predicted protein [Uncinocarpus reesii 1704]
MNEPEVYMFRRDEPESQRLNHQHALLAKFSHRELLHRSIDRSKIVNVADIATGTGIWLQDLSSLLKNVPGTGPRYYHGFDISPSQFPPDEENIKFTVHDTLKPFPKEHWARYDVVHVRLVFLAIKECDIMTALHNMTQLLKPGGYLHWDEFDGDSFFGTQNIPGSSVIADYARSVGLTMSVSQVIRDAAEKAGLQDISRESYSSSQPVGLTRRCEAMVS